MGSGSITSWERDGETVETVSDFIFWGSKITADGDCSHEIKRHSLGFPGGSEVKASASDAGDPGLIPGSGRSPGEGHGNPTPVFLPGESHRRRSLAGYIYGPWGRRESDTTE